MNTHETSNVASLELEDQLKAFFGYNAFREHQRDIVRAVMNRQDVVAILPTGAGKSICYQLPAMLMPGLAIVVSPLISLMQDQVLSLTKNGIPAAFLNSSLHFSDIRSVLNNLSDYKLLYIAPERFADQNFVQSLKSTTVSFFAIDEAHCISQWGHAFRPEYRQLSFLKTTFPNSPIIALTATATKDVEKDITAQLAMINPYTIRASFDRPNLTFSIHTKGDTSAQLRRFIDKHPDQSGIIYAATRKTVDETHSELSAQGFSVGKYHAGLSEVERSDGQHRFVHDQCRLMVATVAFGMGIHKPDIRFIVHMDMPRSIEQYYQEVGRGGRDGLPADCLMLYSGQDLRIYQSFLSEIVEEELKRNIKDKTNKMYKLCCTMSCRRKELLHYFDENYRSSNCGGCDNCLDNTELIDETVVAQKILSCVHRLGQRFGAKQVIDVLKGSKAKNVVEKGHDQLSTYGLMSEYSETSLRHYIEMLVELEFLARSEGDYPVLQWTNKSSLVTSGQEKVFLRQKIQHNAPKALAVEYDRELFTELSTLRHHWAEKTNVPAFVIFGDRTLIEMATSYPTTRAAFLAMNGAGPVKWEKYGQQFLDVIIEYCEKKGIVITNRLEKAGKAGKAYAMTSSSTSDGGLGRDRLRSAKETLRLFSEGRSLEEICHIRNLTPVTTIDHLCEMIALGINIDITPFVAIEKQEAINNVIAVIGSEKLKPIKLMLSDDYTYLEIRLVVAIQRKGT
ncbi:MAG: DNA helicase RecQ [Parachlamydiaceae bacterium]|nr:DNA helicase RecQ [Parachlamydiaceae bacterium]